MAREFSTLLQQLLLQAKFAPDSKRLQQIEACQALIRLIKPGASYPFDFIQFHLTGYRPHSGKNFQTDNILTYNDLLRDLPAYAAQLSKTLQIPTSKAGQKVYSIKSLAKRFRVCTKTISRWRQKGLVGSYYIFPDGRQRLAFTESMVEFYVSQNRRQIQQSESFSKISPQDRQSILNRLSRWSYRCPHHRQEAINRTARRFNRSVESVRTILTQAEQDSCANIQFERRPWCIPQYQRCQIYEQYRQGIAVAEIMKNFGRSRSNIYHAINLEHAEQLLKIDIAYITSDEFEKPGNKDSILNSEHLLFPEEVHKKEKRASILQPQTKVTETLTSYVKDINVTDLLNANQEKYLFRRYNYQKFLAAKLQKRIDPQNPSGQLLNSMRLYMRGAQQDKDRLIRSNLRLVVSVARRHTRNEAEMTELISEGNMALLNAVDKFDYSRGVKFSTYATWAIVKRFATLRTQQNKRPVHETSEELLVEVAHDMRVKDSRVAAVETARKSLEEVMAENLEDRERTIVKEHYGLIRQTEISGQRKAKSLSQIAQVLGISKERVRRIEMFALQKLRRVMSQEQFDLLTNA